MNNIRKAIEDCKSKIEEYRSDYKCWVKECKIEETKLKALEKQLNNGWISVNERLPMQEDGRGVWVLTCATSGLVESNHFCNGRFYDADKNGYKIVAWQPLPEKYESK